MDVTLLCIGDVVGRPGRSIVSQAVPRLVKQRNVDCVIANVENAAAGSGLTEALFHKFRRYGINVMTLGDHIYRKWDLLPVLEDGDCIIKPANYPAEAVGRPYALFETQSGAVIAVMSLMGRLYMRPPADCPFHAADRILSQLPSQVKTIVVDMHAEATSEKVAMGWHLDGRVSVVFGTHTHIPTADETILEGGTAYITDLGMTGPYDSVLGRRKDRVLKAMITGMPAPFEVASGNTRLCGILVRIDSETGHARHIERITVDGAHVHDIDPHAADDDGD